jgi:hypothetical protein
MGVQPACTKCTVFEVGTLSFFPSANASQVTRVPPYVRYPFPSQESRHVLERDDLGPPVVPGVRDRVGIPKSPPEGEIRPTGRAVSKQRLGDWDGLADVSAPWCTPGVPLAKRGGGHIHRRRSHARQGVPGQTENGCMVLAVKCWAASAQRRCYPTGRCTYRPSVTCCQ